jgi:hypothetical protein
MVRKLLPRLRKAVADKIHIFGAKNNKSLMLKRPNATEGSGTDLPVSNVDRNVLVSPFSKALAKVSVLGNVAHTEKNVPSFLMQTMNGSPPFPYQALPHQQHGPVISVADNEWVTAIPLPGTAPPATWTCHFCCRQ